MPNTFAYIALIIWPFISILFYKQMSVVKATLWTIVGGFLILPVKTEIDFPLIPPLNKETIPALTALLGCLFVKKARIRLLPDVKSEKRPVVFLILLPFISMFTNQEVINSIAGITIHDAISHSIHQYLTFLPFILGMQIIRTREDQIFLFRFMVTSFLFYSIPILYEIRMSPQLHTYLYGFFPHEFSQQYRAGGFRAVVFLGHGLAVSMYLALALGFAAILQKQRIKMAGVSMWPIILFFLFLLVINKSLGGLMLGLLLFVSITWLPSKAVIKLSIFLSIIVLLYPLISLSGNLPYQELVELASDIDPERGASLAFRFYNEHLLLEHAREKLLLGWGGMGRNRLPGSVTDGHWIITFGVFGLIGFMALYGLILNSVRKSLKIAKLSHDENDKNLLFYHALVVTVIMIDQMPNASLGSLMFFIIGALFGRINWIKNELAQNKYHEI